eukprot:CAMPEP_0174367072 /NCGR_PEP_ID=MMETSP0811_2-20130205/83713_1 /TAXON_ID=73025 ORGANISM="Eutreptiella gymnastica-like, Strain CCMP1594" /NCGR_SAMPLE_ID=MMETSP0811_2 /ASSEMBLY_ACC=CAM_ASM_000667 /LENGTH=326 /DNA_ID=CAMNT_0015509245 /DNA_START=1 /DNA_END=977 /DNA_ORIENTATION=-
MIENNTRTSVLYLVDLAGSESVGKTGASGQTLEEAKKINQSLSALKGVITALVAQANKKPKPGAPKLVVPYRESMLTRLLMNALGGNSRTTMCICVSAAEENVHETESTLLFGQAATKIQMLVQSNVHRSVEELEALLADAQSVLLELREKIRQLESRVPALEAAAAAESLGSPNPPVQTPTGRVIPEAFKCPLTKKVMTNPVICANGHTYERKTLVKWYRMFQTLPTVPPTPNDQLLIDTHFNDVLHEADDHVEPLSREATPSDSFNPGLTMVPNFNLLDQIRRFQQGETPLKQLRSRRSFRVPFRRFPIWNEVVNVTQLPNDCT